MPTITFAGAADQGSGSSYSEAGFTFVPSPTAPGSTIYIGEESIAANWTQGSGPQSYLQLTKDNTSPFTLTSVDIDSFSSGAAVEAVMIGRFSDGSTIQQSFTTDNVDGSFETVQLTGFTNIVAFEFSNDDAPYVQYDNFVIADARTVVPTLTGGELATYGDTTAFDTFPVRTGQIDNDPTANVNVVGNLSDADGSGSYSFALTGQGAANIVANNVVVGTEISGTYGQLIVATDGRYQFMPNSDAINALAPGQSLTLNYTVAVTDVDVPEGTAPATATFTVTLTGAADSVHVTGGTLATYTDTGANDTFAVMTGRIDRDVSASSNGVGQVVADTGTMLTYSLASPNATAIRADGVLVGTELVTNMGRLVLATDGRYQFVPNAEAINALPVGSNPTQSFDVTVNGSNGTSSNSAFTVSFVGATETAVSLTGGELASYEDSVNSEELITGRLDTDRTGSSNGVGALDGGTGTVTYALTGSGVEQIAGGTLVDTEYGQLIVASDGRYQFRPYAAAIEALPEGADKTLTFSVQVMDANGSTGTADYTISLSGEYTRPLFDGGLVATYDDTGAADTFSIVEGAFDSDPRGDVSNGLGQLSGDYNEARTFDLLDTNATLLSTRPIYYDTGSESVVVGTAMQTNFGTLIVSNDGRYQFTPNSDTINSLPEGDDRLLWFRVQVRDPGPEGSAVYYAYPRIEIQLNGAADEGISLRGGSLLPSPIIDSELPDTIFGVWEGRIDSSPLSVDSAVYGPNNEWIPITGTLIGDADQTYTFALYGEGVETISGGSVLNTEFGQLIVASDGRYQFVTNAAAIDALGDELRTLSIAIQVTSSSGAEAIGNFTIDLQGAEEAPVVTIPSNFYVHSLIENDASLIVAGQIEATDVPGNTVTYSYDGKADDPYTMDVDGDFSYYYSVDQDSYQTGTLTEAQIDLARSAFSLDPITGSYSFNLDSPDFLEAGQYLNLQYNVHVGNQLGASTTALIQVVVQGSSETRVVGTSGDDVLNGTEFGDTINGGSGDDIIYGNGGDDILRGGSGDDILLGGRGSNVLDGGSGTDVAILGGRLQDYVFERTGETTGVLYREEYLEFGRPTSTIVESHQLINIETVQFGNGQLVDFASLDGFDGQPIAFPVLG